MSLESRVKRLEERLRALEAAQPRAVVLAEQGETVAECRDRLGLGPDTLVVEVQDASRPD